jgi:hypothetical protein
MKLDTLRAVLDILVICFALPLGAWKAWRKLDERLTEQDKQLVKINYQLWENGGNSMKDQVNKLVVDVAVLKANRQ